MTSVSVTPIRRAMIFTWSSRISPSSRMEILLWALRRLKNTFFWLAVVPIFTSDHERWMYSWIATPAQVGVQVPNALLEKTGPQPDAEPWAENASFQISV